MTAWPLEIDGREYAPIPSTWIEHGTDRNHGDPRVYAVSVARSARDMLRIRYIARDGGVYRQSTPSAPNPTGEGVVPASLADVHDWPRSIIPPRDVDAVDTARDLELEHLTEIWSDIIDDVEKDDLASDDRRLAADGGRERDEFDVDARTALRHALQEADHERERELIREALQLDVAASACGGGSR